MSENESVTGRPWADPDDAPERTDEWFQQADQYIGERLVRRGRPKAAVTKVALSVRLDADIVAAFRATGRGWQTRINGALKQWLADRGGRAE